MMGIHLHKSLSKYSVIMATHHLKPSFEHYIIVATHRHNYLRKCTISLPTHLPELPAPHHLRVPHWSAPVTIRML
jgi:hypothetical protein